MIRQNVNEKDKRVIKTKKSILNALTELLGSSNINEITITDIARKADVNRKTIYNYYNGVYEILDAVEKECISNFQRVVYNIPTITSSDDFYKVFENITNLLNTDSEFYIRLIHIKNNTAIVKRIYDSILGEFKNALSGAIQPTKCELIAHFILSGIISSYIYWNSQEEKPLLEEYSKEIANLVLSGIKPYLKEN